MPNIEVLSDRIKMTDSTHEEMEENPIETVISRGASLTELAKTSISRKRQTVVNIVGNMKRVASTRITIAKRRFGTALKTIEFSGQH